ncbi:hypothetical protein CO2235_200072 [Cupriavidus oxalaticus]|uniref:Uncharacterized protein n=1 Tax=Cupriavidus oxalaticus TaxID=96344 RepID=A0A976BCH2_9BURK|nr:hypothetical protein CO2235_200072 [Cupriavidus oxalaticus]
MPITIQVSQTVRNKLRIGLH